MLAGSPHTTIPRLDAAHELQRRREARSHLRAFIPYLNPAYSMQWFHLAICNVIDDCLRGLLPKTDPDYNPNAPKRIILNMPPRNGKTEIASRNTPAYMLGRNPDVQIIATSYGADLASMVNRDVQQIIDSSAYARVFPGTKLNTGNVRTTAYGQPLRNSDIFEIVGHDGVYKSAGIGGAMTGYGMHLGIIDDPIKNRDEAYSDVYRAKVWYWYTQTFYTRLLPGGAIIIMMTRWHDDDLVGRLLEQERNDPDADRWVVLDFPAIYDHEPDPETEPHSYAARQYDPRKLHDPLWPAAYPLAALKTMQALDPDGFEALQQQRPVKPGGALFPETAFKLLDAVTVHDAMVLVRYWDKAATHGGGAYTAGVLMAFDPTRAYGVGLIVLDVQRMQYDPFEREALIKRTAQYDAMQFNDPQRVTVWLEQEPGSGGKESALNTVINTLAGYTVYTEAPTGAKAVRWQPYAVQVKAGNVGLVKAVWTPDYIRELSRLPGGKYKDQADASSGACAKLLLGWEVTDHIIVIPHEHISEY